MLCIQVSMFVRFNIDQLTTHIVDIYIDVHRDTSAALMSVFRQFPHRLYVAFAILPTKSTQNFHDDRDQLTSKPPENRKESACI